MARILIIDDETALRDVLARLFEREGHEVCTAGDGVEGLQLWREQGAAVVILDIHMPRSDGIETLVQLRALAPALPVIVISGAIRPALSASWAAPAFSAPPGPWPSRSR
jgi:CheY-like chemotaxis protein